MGFRQSFVILALIGCALAWSGEYIPKSFYVIDPEGHQSEVVYFRSRRDVERFPLFRVKRGGGGGGSFSSASSSASSSSNAGATPYGYGGGQSFSSASSSSSANSGTGYGAGPIPAYGPGGPGGAGFGAGGGGGYGGGSGGGSGGGPTLFSRFGEEQGTGVHVSGTVVGERGAFSSSSTSVDEDGKIKYSVQSGKF